jgi:stalled ribosome rescue protein Dom34
MTRIGDANQSAEVTVMHNKHVAIWIDHKEAHVFHIHPDEIDETTVKAPQHLHHRHPKGPEGGKEHPDDAKRFFHEVARLLDSAEEILIVGPSTGKLELLRYLHRHDHALESRIVGVETVDHPTDGQLVAYAKKYFKRSDQMR